MDQRVRLQRKHDRQPDPEAASPAPGRSLDPAARAFLEPRLGHSFGDVQIHADAEADALAREFEARAFTVGSDIYFRSGAYDPSSPGGLHLLGHELAHTVQQAAGPVSGTEGPGGVRVSDPSDSFEQAAERAADAALLGLPAGVGAGVGGAGGGAAALTVQRDDDDDGPMPGPWPRGLKLPLGDLFDFHTSKGGFGLGFHGGPFSGGLDYKLGEGGLFDGSLSGKLGFQYGQFGAGLTGKLSDKGLSGSGHLGYGLPLDPFPLKPPDAGDPFKPGPLLPPLGGGAGGSKDGGESGGIKLPWGIRLDGMYSDPNKWGVGVSGGFSF